MLWVYIFPTASKNCFRVIRDSYAVQIVQVEFNFDISILGIHSSFVPNHDISQMLETNANNPASRVSTGTHTANAAL
jgi:hypothetical protein